jgi:hypothetical protein
MSRSNYHRRKEPTTQKYLVCWPPWARPLPLRISGDVSCRDSGLICDTSAPLSPQLLSVAAAMAELPLMGNARAGKAGCSKSVDPRISVSAYWAGPRAVCQSPPNSRIGEPAKGHQRTTRLDSSCFRIYEAYYCAWIVGWLPGDE